MNSQIVPPQGLKKSDYEFYPRSLAPDDFWGQVRRTVNGVPVSDEQIRMIVDAIMAGLDPGASDTVLDLACGNGALSRHLYEHCAALLGVDYSEYLISVARKHFEQAPRFTYQHREAADYVSSESDPLRFTKVLCYGSFSYFPAEGAETVLSGLRRRFANVERVFIGNLPDRDLAHEFYAEGLPEDSVLDDHTEQIGTWRSRRQFSELALRCGWHATFSTMPEGFFARYRYDALLTPA